ncbi:MAG: NADH-quinone oxidoreductase subunit M, partial [bacterium]
YGLIRLAIPLFPSVAASAGPLICILAVIGIIYGAWVASVQRDVKRLVAYSSVSHLGLVVLGLFVFTPNGATGAVLQMVNHGLTTGALFLIVGMLYERRHTRLIADYGGIIKVMPMLGVIFWIVTFASIGLPPLNGFIGEFMILLGVFESRVVGHNILGAFAVTGIIWSAIYMLNMFAKVMLGTIKHKENTVLRDLDHRELFVLIPILILIFYIGLFSPNLTNKIQPDVVRTLGIVENAKIDSNSVMPRIDKINKINTTNKSQEPTYGESEKPDLSSVKTQVETMEPLDFGTGGSGE